MPLHAHSTWIEALEDRRLLSVELGQAAFLRRQRRLDRRRLAPGRRQPQPLRPRLLRRHVHGHRLHPPPRHRGRSQGPAHRLRLLPRPGQRLPRRHDQHQRQQPRLRLRARVYYDYQAGKDVTYWFFYAHNDGFGPQNHEGDWERVEVHLNARNRAVSTVYHRHGGSQTLSWADTPKVGRTHPVVFSAKGFGGAWGEVDNISDTTGPLGPSRYK